MTTPAPGPWFFEDFTVGDRFTTQARTITEADVVSFAGWCWDTNPVHTDAVSGAAGRFGSPIAHGLLGMSVAMGLVSRLGLFEGSSIALLGVDDWTFAGPIRVGDTLTCELEITGGHLTSRGDAGVLDRRFSLRNQDGAEVQSGRIDLMVAVRPG
ncbi:MAG: MaoC/PaaZ C-terminal domain-containing protein [Aeromicrobium sp.]